MTQREYWVELSKSWQDLAEKNGLDNNRHFTKSYQLMELIYFQGALACLDILHPELMDEKLDSTFQICRMRNDSISHTFLSYNHEN